MATTLKRIDGVHVYECLSNHHLEPARMRNYILGILTGISFLVSLLVVVESWRGEARAQNVGSILGAGDAGQYTETITWNNLKGASRSGTLQRQVLKVPQNYGKVAGFDDGHLWFVDAAGALRNVKVGGSLVKIEFDAK